MEILRVAQTIADVEEFGERSGYVPHWELDKPPGAAVESPEWKSWIKSLPLDSDELAEMAGRLCYKSWDRPNPTTAKNSDYIANIIRQKHFSVLEHASVSYYVRGVSRSLLTELERHRHLSFSVVSQRYVDHGEADYVAPPAFYELDVSDHEEMMEDLRDLINMSHQAYSFIEYKLLSCGFKKKEAREAARAVLPSATTTEFIVTGNLRTWREILQKRIGPTVDKEFNQLATLILADLKEYAPATFQDFEEEV